MVKKENTIKLSILGSNDLETLSFIRKITLPLFESNLKQTIGVDFYTEMLSFNTNNNQINIKINFWVISNQERFRFLARSYIQESDGFIILLNLSEMKGYHDAKYWISIIREKCKQTPILLITYSIDEREIITDLIQEVVNESNYITYIELSLDNEMDVRGSIILLSCIILHLQIPYDIQQRFNLLPYFPIPQYVKEDKEVLTGYIETPTSFTLYKYSYTEFLKAISTILDDPYLQKIEPHLERLKDYIDQQEIKVNSMKGKFLEMNTRRLYEREYGYEIDYTEKDFECEIDEIEVLYNNNCLKSRKTKDIQIDIFGKKEYGSDFIYLIGECKDRYKKITLKEIKCFIIKARIIATFYLYFHKREKKPIPKFHLLIVSLHGFPDKQRINKILEDNWHCNIPKKRILNESINLLAKKKFVDLLRKNNISTSDYKD